VSKKRTLHLLKNAENRDPIDFIQHIEQSYQISIVLIQDAIETDLSPLTTEPCILSEDLLSASAKTRRRKITYARLIDMIFEHDAVVSW